MSDSQQSKVPELLFLLEIDEKRMRHGLLVSQLPTPPLRFTAPA